MRRTIRFKRTVQPKKKISKFRVVFVIFVGFLSFCMGYMSVRPLFLIFGLVT